MDFVVLVHGLAAHPVVMKPLEWRLKRYGFQVCQWSYPSLRGCIESHGKQLEHFLQQLGSRDQPVHLVAHSLGTVVVRYMLSQREPQGGMSFGPSHRPNLSGRSVFLAPPSTGTPVARIASKILGRICPAIAQLSDAATSFTNQLPTLHDQEIGIVTARFDLMVPQANTRLAEATHYTEVFGTHSSMLFQSRTAWCVARFLREGKFGEKQPSPAATASDPPIRMGGL